VGPLVQVRPVGELFAGQKALLDAMEGRSSAVGIALLACLENKAISLGHLQMMNGCIGKIASSLLASG
jgi:hypothetical protein